NAVRARDFARDLLLQVDRGGVEQGIQSALAESRADPENHGRNGQARQSVRVSEPGKIPRLTNPNQANTGDDDDGAPDVGGEVKSVGFESFAGVFLGDVPERAGSSDVDG